MNDRERERERQIKREQDRERERERQRESKTEREQDGERGRAVDQSEQAQGNVGPLTMKVLWYHVSSGERRRDILMYTCKWQWYLFRLCVMDSQECRWKGH